MTIPAAQALAIAQADALKAYKNLSTYTVRSSLQPDGWHVDYELRDPHQKGGGGHYVIDATSGAVISNMHEQ